MVADNSESAKAEVTIYAFHHPDWKRDEPGSWIYVGHTARELQERLREHLEAADNGSTSPWPMIDHLRELLNEDRMPVGGILETCPYELRYSAEAYWICILKTEGHNVVNGGGREVMIALDWAIQIATEFQEAGNSWAHYALRRLQ